MIENLLRHARQTGLDVRLVDDRLRVRGPHSASPLVEQLRRQSAHVIKHLSDNETETPESAEDAGVSLPEGWDSSRVSLSLGWLGEWALLLDEDDLPANLSLGPGQTIVHRARYLAWLQADVRRGIDGPRARTGGLQAELQALWAALLGESSDT